MDGDDQDSKPSTEGSPNSVSHASFFLLPSGGGEERRERNHKQSEENKDKHKHTHTLIIQASMAKPWVYLQVVYLQARALCTRSASALHFLELLSLMLVVSSLYRAL